MAASHGQLIILQAFNVLKQIPSGYGTGTKTWNEFKIFILSRGGGGSKKDLADERLRLRNCGSAIEIRQPFNKQPFKCMLCIFV